MREDNQMKLTFGAVVHPESSACLGSKMARAVRVKLAVMLMVALWYPAQHQDGWGVEESQYLVPGSVLNPPFRQDGLVVVKPLLWCPLLS